jgi:hypothetical protein
MLGGAYPVFARLLVTASGKDKEFGQDAKSVQSLSRWWNAVRVRRLIVLLDTSTAGTRTCSIQAELCEARTKPQYGHKWVLPHVAT